MQTKETAQTKTYVLLESMDANAPIFLQTPEGRRSQIKKIPRHRPYLQVTFQDENGESKTIRYKEACNTILLEEQVDKFKIPANAKFTQTERDAPYFKFGILTTNKKNLQQFLESHPEFDGFKGYCDVVKSPKFRLLDEKKEEQVKNTDIKKRINAGYKIINMNLEDAQELLIRINGSHFEVPDDLATCQNMLTDFLDDTNERGLDEILKEKPTSDDAMKVLVGKLINAKLLEFDAEGEVKKQSSDGSKFVVVKSYPSQYPIDEKVQMFSLFLNTDEGKNLKEDLKKDLEKFEKAKKKPIDNQKT